MGKYSDLQNDAFSVFNSNAWKAENIKTFPDNFVAIGQGSEFIRVSIISRSPSVNLDSVAGVFIIDIFTSAGNGPKQAALIADKLDQYLVGKNISTQSGAGTQLLYSTLDSRGLDKDNPTLFRSVYTIPFNYFRKQ